jgi:hypothetical protein
MLHKHVEDYLLVGGSKVFDAVQIRDCNCMIQVDYDDLIASDVIMELEQSISRHGKFDKLNSSTITLDPSKTSHTWNIAGFAKGIYIRVILSTGSAAEGIINFIAYLY